MTKQQKVMAFIESHAVRAVALGDEQILVEEMYATGPDGFPDTAKEMYARTGRSFRLSATRPATGSATKPRDGD